MKKGLIVFAREPLSGKVKTRLAATLGDQAAVELYERMLQDVLKICRQLDDVETNVYWACAEESLSNLAERYRCRSRRQSAGGLGERMQAAIAEMFADGCEVCCIIGSDAPDLPIPYLREAYRLLETMQSDVVFGPTRDGGYYLLGQRRIWPQLFTDIPWSSAAVLTASLAAAHASGATTELLPQWQDIDTIEDLAAYRERNCMTQSGGMHETDCNNSRCTAGNRTARKCA